METPVRSGEVTIGKGKSKRKKHYAKLFKASTTGLSRLEIYENAKSSVGGVPTDWVLNGDVVRIVPTHPGGSNSEHLFAILTKEKNTYVFGVKTELLRSEWVKDFSSILFQAQQNKRHSSKAPSRNNTVTDNDIYDSADEYIRDHFVMVSDETCRRLSTQAGRVKLLVEQGNITIITMQGQLLGRWGIEHLRRFGYSDTDFHFEAGRKSELGPGLFSFNTDKGRSIHMMVTREKQVCRGNRGTPGETEPPAVSAAQEDLLNFDGHLYEELSVSQQPAQKPNKGDTVSKPPRRNNAEPTTPTSNPPQSFYYTNHTAANNGATSASQVYTDVTRHQNAWQEHGRDVEDEYKTIYEDGPYNTLSHTTPTNSQNDSVYTTTSRQPQIQEHQDDIENMYAVIDKSAKKPKENK